MHKLTMTLVATFNAYWMSSLPLFDYNNMLLRLINDCSSTEVGQS